MSQEIDNHPFLENKVIIMNGFSNEEINAVMKAVRSAFPPRTDLIFAKTTPSSLNMVLKELIVDMSEDHDYLKKNPPQAGKKAE